MAAYEVLLLNTAVPQIQAAQSGDTYVVPRDIAFSAALTLSGGTANGVPYLSSPGKVLTTGSALTFDGTNLLNDQSTASPIGIRLRNGSTSTSAGTRVAFEFGGSTTGYIGNQFDGGDFNTQYMAANKHIWYRGVSDAMILTSTGLGIGTNNPAYKLDVVGVTASGNGTITTGLSWDTGGLVGTFSNHALGILTNGNVVAKFDTSGNLGLGVTPSAWRSGTPAFQIGSAGVCLFADSGIVAGLGNNMFLSSASEYVYLRNDLASRYQQYQGIHSWLTTSVSGTANTATITNGVSYTIITSGNQTSFGAANNNVGTSFIANSSGTLSSGTVSQNISFSTAMTLDASGNLVVGGPSAVITGAGRGNVTINGSSTAIMALSVGGAAKGSAYHNGTDLEIINYHSGGDLTFYINGGYRARITSGGKIAAASSLAGDNLFTVDNTSATGYGISVSVNNNSSGTYRFFEGVASGSTQTIAIYTNGDVKNTNGVFAAFSDAKLKKDIVDAGSQWNDIKAIRVRKYKLKNDPEGIVQIGLVAQEV